MSITIAGHRYSDPDVLSLIYNGSEIRDPRKEVVARARALNQQLLLFPPVTNPRQRMEILASLAGVRVQAMSTTDQNREALLFRSASGHTHAFYDPTLSDGRTNFSIAHEIIHTFFPNSSSGARFRSLHVDNSREATELERLCHLGASELLMPSDDFVHERGNEFGLRDVPRLAERFGSSYEATVYRLATSYSGVALAGRLTFGYRRQEGRQLAAKNQKELFTMPHSHVEAPKKKYRRQSLHSSESCTPKHWIPFNKSFEETSCIYAAATSGEIIHAIEKPPNRAASTGHLEAVQAPYQYPTSDVSFPDLFFLWREG